MADFAKTASREIEKEVNAALKTIEALGKEFDTKERRKLLRPAGNVLKTEISNNAPTSKKAHYRYASAKLDATKRAQKGSGQKVATYYPGNLRRAIKVMTFRKSAALFIGPRYAKKNKSGEFKGNRVDGFYARFLEFGTRNFTARPFIRPAVASAKSQIINKIKESTKTHIKKFATKHKK